MLETSTRMIKIKIDLHQERISRKKIAQFASAKLIPVQPPVKYPDQIPKIRIYEQLKPIKYTLLDGIGLVPKIYFAKDDFSKQPIKSATLRPSNLSNLSSNLPKISDNINNTSTSHTITSSSFGTIRSSNSKGRNSIPPSAYGSLLRNPKDQRIANSQLLMVAPPQVPSNYSISSVDNEQSNKEQETELLDGKKCRFKTNPANNESIPDNYIDKGKYKMKMN